MTARSGRIEAMGRIVARVRAGEVDVPTVAAVALMLIRGDVDSPGVQGPESAVDPDVYFRELTAISGGQADADRLVEVLAEEVRADS